MPKASVAVIAPSEVQRVAVAAQVDPRTVESYIYGERRTMRASCAAIERELRAIGRADLVRTAAAA